MKKKKTTSARARTTGSGARGSARRQRISPRGDARFIRRDAKGRITESDDAGRSFRADRRKKAKTKVKSGYGDRGDRRSRSSL
jgi:hypothetical protein